MIEKLPAKAKLTYTVLMDAYVSGRIQAVPLLTAYQKTRNRCGSMGYGRWLEKYINPLAEEGFGHIEGSEFILSARASALVVEEHKLYAKVPKADLVPANLISKFRTENFGPGDRMFEPPAREGASDFLQVPSVILGSPVASRGAV